MRFNVQSSATIAFSLLAILSRVDQAKAMTERGWDIPPQAATITSAEDVSAQRSMVQPEQPELDNFGRALLANAARLARTSEPPLERAEVLIDISGAYRWSGNHEIAQGMLSEAHLSILQIEPVAVRIKKLGELAGHHWANYQDRAEAISLLQEAEQFLPLLPDAFEELHYAISELTFRYGLLGETEKALALVESLPESFSHHTQQQSLIYDQIWSQVEQGASAEELLSKLDSIERPYSVFDADTTGSCCDEDCCEIDFEKEAEPPSPVSATLSDWEKLLELEEVARRYVEAGRIEDANVALAEVRTRLEQLPLSGSLLNFKISFASFFQNVLEDRERWSQAVDVALATFQQFQTDPSFNTEELSFLSFSLMQLNKMLRELGRTEEAIALLQAPSDRNESIADQVDRQLMLVATLREDNQADSALMQLNRAANLSRNHATDWDYRTEQTWRQLQVAEAYLGLQQPELAGAMFEQIRVTAQQTSAEGDDELDEYISQEDLWTLFDYLVELNKIEEAIALANATDLEDRLGGFIATLARQGKLEDAVDLANKLADPHIASEAWTYIAAAYGAAAQPDLANEALTKAWQVIQTIQAEEAGETDQAAQLSSLEYLAKLFYNSSSPAQMETQAIRLQPTLLRTAFIQELLQSQDGSVESSPTLLELQFETLQQIPPAQRKSYWSLALIHRYAVRRDYGKAIAVTAALDYRHRQAANLIHLLETYLDQSAAVIDSAALEQQLSAL